MPINDASNSLIVINALSRVNLTIITLFTATILIGLYPVAAYADDSSGIDGKYPPPLQQQRDGVSLDAIMCNPSHELYLKNTDTPVCLTSSTYERLLEYGLDLTPQDEPATDHTIDIITIGAITPLTGGAAGYGQTILAGSELAVSDFNKLLEDMGETWRLEMDPHDSMTSDDAQLSSLMLLNEKGIKIVNGPSIDIFDQKSLDYANDNGMLLFSCCSVVLAHSIADDMLFRISADQTNHGRVLAEVMHNEGVTSMVTVGRDAPWITDILDSADARLLELGGHTAGSHVLYDMSGAFDDATVQMLADMVAEHLALYDSSKVGVLFVGFEESYDFLELASSHDILEDVRWFGADINTIVHDNQDGLEFADNVDFMSIQPTAPESEIGTRVSDHIAASIGRTPSVYGLMAYDVVQLIGHAILEVQGDAVSDVADAIPRVAQNYAGASSGGGPISFNDAGDRDSMVYDVWAVDDDDGVWVRHGTVTPSDMMVVPQGAEFDFDTWNPQGSGQVESGSYPSSPSVKQPSSPVYSAPSAPSVSEGAMMDSDDSLGFAVGGAKDIGNFRENIAADFLPLYTDITHEGLFYDYYFDTRADTQECESLFCPSYVTAVSADPFLDQNQYYLSVGLDSGLKESDFERKNLNLVIVMDVSGSMSSPFNQYHYDSHGNYISHDNPDDDFSRSKMAIANESVVGLLDHLTDDDRLGIVLFNNGGHLAKPLESMRNTDRDALAENILAIYADGGTNMDAGITMGTSLFDKVVESEQSDYENRIIFLTDAMPNTGSTQQDQLFNLIEWNAGKKIYTTVIGVGVDFNTELIEYITDVRGANYYSVHSSSEFLERMTDEFEFMVTPLVFDLTLRLDTDGYKILDVYGVPESNSFTDDLIHVNTLFPSRVHDGETRGGIILIKMDKLSDTAVLELNASYVDRDGRIDSSIVSVNIDDEPHYQNSGIQKGILLSRYADLMKTWAYDERSSHAGNTPHGHDYLYDEGIGVPEHVGISLGQWERQSVPLTVSSDYAAIIEEFSAYFSQEASLIGDVTLLQEVDVMSALLSEHGAGTAGGTWNPQP